MKELIIYRIKISPTFSEHRESRGILQKKLFSINSCRDEIFKLPQQWLKFGERYKQVYQRSHSVTSIFRRISLKVQNSDIEKCIEDG